MVVSKVSNVSLESLESMSEQISYPLELFINEYIIFWFDFFYFWSTLSSFKDPNVTDAPIWISHADSQISRFKTWILLSINCDQFLNLSRDAGPTFGNLFLNMLIYTYQASRNVKTFLGIDLVGHTGHVTNFEVPFKVSICLGLGSVEITIIIIDKFSITIIITIITIIIINKFSITIIITSTVCNVRLSRERDLQVLIIFLDLSM